MKVLAISHSAVVSDYQDRFLEVARRGVDVTLLVPRRWKQFNRMVALEKASDPYYDIVPRQPFTWGLRHHGLRNITHIYAGLGSLLESVKPHIIEVWEEPFSAVTAHVVFLARRMITPVKILFFSAQNIPRRFPPPFSLFERYTLGRADFAYCMNGEVERVIRAKGYAGESLVLPLGVNPDRFRKMEVSGLKKELGISRFTVGFAGKLDRQKGILDLVEACAPLKDEVDVLIIGAGPLEEAVRGELARHGLSERARVLEPVSHALLPRYLNCMDVLVMPSRTLPGLKEQFGRILVEAMACAVPVLGSDSGEIPNVIGAAGRVFPEGDGPALTSLLRGLMGDTGLAGSLAGKGRKRVEERYAWHVIAARQIGVYHRLMSGSSTKADMQ